MDCPPNPQFYINFLLRYKTYSKECPPTLRENILSRVRFESVSAQCVVPATRALTHSATTAVTASSHFDNYLDLTFIVLTLLLASLATQHLVIAYFSRSQSPWQLGSIALLFLLLVL